MAEFAFYNAKNANISYTLFELNCRYHPCIFYENALDLCLKSRTIEELSPELRELRSICQQNLHYT